MRYLIAAHTAPTHVETCKHMSGGTYPIEHGVESKLFYSETKDLASTQARATKLLGRPAKQIYIGRYEGSALGSYFAHVETILG